MTQLHRLGSANLTQPPINKPGAQCIYQRDGVMQMNINQGTFPNSLGGGAQ